MSELDIDAMVTGPTVQDKENKKLKAELKEAKQRIAELEAHVKECSEYLDTNRFTNIGHESILHRNMKSLLKGRLDE